MSAPKKSTTHKLNISGFVYVKDPKDQSRINSLVDQVESLKSSNANLVAENKRLTKLVNKDVRASVLLGELSDILGKSKLELKEYVAEIKRVYNMRLYDFIEADTYRSDAALKKIDSVLAKIKKVSA